MCVYVLSMFDERQHKYPECWMEKLKPYTIINHRICLYTSNGRFIVFFRLLGVKKIENNKSTINYIFFSNRVNIIGVHVECFLSLWNQGENEALKCWNRTTSL